MSGLFKKFAGLALVATAISMTASASKAALVTYSTSGAFGGSGAAGNVLTVGGITVTFVGQAPNTVDPDSTGTNADFGVFVTSGAAASNVSLNGRTFTLTITQTAPGPGNTTFSATVSGTIRTRNSQAFVDFNPGPFSIVAGNMTTSYQILNAARGIPGNVALNPPGQTSTVNGFITQAVPEPASMVLSGMGLVSVAGAALRRRKATPVA